MSVLTATQTKTNIGTKPGMDPASFESAPRGSEWEDKHLVFSVAGEEYAVPVGKVREIIGISPISLLPNLPSHIKGILNLRGSVVPIVDLRLKYGLIGRDYDDRTCIVVLELKGEEGPVLMGVVVDAVNDVARIPPDAVSPPPPAGCGRMTDAVRGVATADNQVRILLDIEASLADDAFHGDGSLS